MIQTFFALLISIFFANPQAVAHSAGPIIRMTNKGFEPAYLTVDKNTTVEFVNYDEVDRWPASNVHPLHEIYPEFDPKKPINPNSEWSFKFAKVGVFRYHDHLFPHKRGLIKVVEEQSSTAEIINESSKNKAFINLFKEKIVGFVDKIKSLFVGKVKSKTYRKTDTFITLGQKEQFKVLANIAQARGGKDAWNYLVTTFKGQEGTVGGIHDLAHFVGTLLYDRNDFLGLGICTSEFAFGCYHGFLDKAFSKSLDRLNDAEQGCLSKGAVGSGPFASCIHGIGHGISSFYQVSDLGSSLASCEKLTIVSGRQYCYDGVFMEFARDAPIDFFKKSDPIYPCNVIEGKYIFSCGRNQPNVLMNRFNLGFEEVSSICLASNNKDFKSACFDALGFIAASKSFGNSDSIIKECSKITNIEYNARCARSSAGELIFQNISGWQESAPKVCDSLGGDFKKSCNDYLQKLILDYGRIK